jgi:hypothetical protein
MNSLLNVALFQAGWWACVLGAVDEQPWIGVTAVAVILALHVARAARPRREWALAAIAAVAGALFENALARSGWVRYGAAGSSAAFAPLWIVAMWPLFATTLNVSLRRMRAHPGLAALLGLIGGPLAYYAGARLGALDLASPGMALAAIAVGWAILTPALCAAALRFDGYARP